MKGYEAIYGYEDEVPHYHSGIKLDYPDITHYWIKYGTPEDPNAGKKMLLDIAFGEVDWTSGAGPSSSVGMFQQRTSSWGSR